MIDNLSVIDKGDGQSGHSESIIRLTRKLSISRKEITYLQVW
ncbi:hypothetical protein [Chitinophaga pinensis]|nr:hypothetical protein [Chitinophaga pinensis]